MLQHHWHILVLLLLNQRKYLFVPDKFGEHSGLGLNIVKNLVDLHEGNILASNRLDKDGAIVEIRFPSV